jgi:hypothetical protein
MMRLISRYLIIAAAVLSFAWGIPYLCGIAAKKKVYRPFITYSAVLEDFVFPRQHMGRTVYSDASGNEYTLREYERLMPFMFARDLQKWGEYPESVGGERIAFERAVNERDTVRVLPRYIDLSKVRVQLYPLFEAESDFTSLEFPKELFNIKSRMEFINAAENRVNEEKTALFTDALKEAEFAFPAKIIAGNTYPRKPYDFGYFVLDSKNELYHIYQARSKPMVINTGIRTESGIAYITVKEDRYLPYYGLIITENGGVYHILKDNYNLFKLDAEGYNPYRNTLLYMLDPLTLTLKISDKDGERIRVAARDGRFLKEFRSDYESNIYLPALADALFPFVIKNNPYKYGGYICVTLSENYKSALLLSAALALLYAAAFGRKKRRPVRFIDPALILIGGIYALAAILIIEGVRR